jgi:hypothetical protein
VSLKEIKQEAEELGVGFYEKHRIIDLDGADGLMGTFTGRSAEKDAKDWLEMYRESMQADASKEDK